MATGEIISYYSFDTTGGNEYKDSTGRYNLTNSGGTTTLSGLIGTAYYTDNGGDFANITTKPAAIGGLSKLTICGWVKYVSGGGPTLYGVGKANNRIEAFLYDQDGAWNDAGFFYIDTGSGAASGYKNNGLYTEANIAANFQQFCMVFNGSAATNANRLKVYTNNTAQTLTYSGTIPATTPTGFSSGFIGKEPNTPISDSVAYYDEILVYNGTPTATQQSCLYNSGAGRDYAGTQTCLGISSSPTNFSITATDAWDSSAIDDFNATVDGVDYQSVNGTLTTSILSNRTTTFNITVEKYGYHDNLTFNKSASSNLMTVLRSSIIRVRVANSMSNATITGYTINFSGQTSGSTFYPPAGSHTVSVSKTGFLSNTTSVAVSALDNKTVTITMRPVVFLTISSIVSNALGQSDYFNNTAPIIGECGFTHSGNYSASITYSWQNGSSTINEFLETTKTFDSAYYHTCAIRANDSSLWCWGSNAYGKLGTGGAPSVTLYPLKVSGNHRFKEVSLEFDHTCAIRANDSRAMCWGYDGAMISNYDVPTNVPGNYQFKTISAGYHATCGVLLNGSIACWGLGTDGALGNGDSDDRTTPTLINSTDTFTTVSTNHYFSCAIRESDQKILCWGRGLLGQLGDGTNTSRSRPAPILSNETFERVSAGYHHAGGLTTDGQMLIWGWNGDYRNVDGTTAGSTIPKTNTFTGRYSDFQVADGHICAIRANDSRIECGGWNWKGECGIGDTNFGRHDAAPILGDMAFSALKSGHTTNCALRSNDTKMFCWGRNDDQGQIGDGSTANRPQATAVAGPMIVTKNLYNSTEREVSRLPTSYFRNAQAWNFTCEAFDMNGISSGEDTTTFYTYGYGAPPCSESWIAAYQNLSTCRWNDTYIRLKTYTDANACNTTTSLPGDNGTVASIACTGPSTLTYLVFDTTVTTGRVDWTTNGDSVKVYLDNVLKTTSTDISYTFEGLAPSTTYYVNLIPVLSGSSATSRRLNFTTENTDDNAPIMAAVTINPSYVYTDSTLTGTCRATDIDTTDIYYEYQWLVNGTLIKSGTTATASRNTSVSASTINGTSFAFDDTIMLRCRARDQFVYSSWMNTTKMVQNTIPVIDEVFVRNVTGYYNCSYRYTDVDGDTEQNTTFAWRKNSVVVANETAQLINASLFIANDRIRCTIEASDGVIDIGANSTEFVVANSSTFLVGDVQAPILTVVTMPTNVLSDDQMTLRVSCTDDVGVATGYPILRFTDPNLEDHEVRFFYETGDNYVRYYTFNIPGTYTAISAECRDGNAHSDTEVISNIVSTARTITVTLGSGGAAGGGGEEAGDSISFSALQASIIVNPGGTTLGELEVFNKADDNIDVTAVILPNPKTPSAYNWLTFDGQKKTTFFVIEKKGGLSTDSRFLRYQVTVPEGVEPGVYEAIIQVAALETTKDYNVKILVGETLGIRLSNIWNTPLFDLPFSKSDTPTGTVTGTLSPTNAWTVTFGRLVIILSVGTVVTLIGVAAYRRF